MNKLLFLLVPACFMLSGCAGYTLGGQKPSHLRNVTKLAVPTFENRTLEPRLAVLVTNAVIKQLQNHGSYQIVSRSDADAVLEGSILQIQRTQFRSDRNNILRSSQIMATIGSGFVIKDTAGVVLHNGSASASSHIILDSNLQLSETQLLENAAQQLAFELADQISEGW